MTNKTLSESMNLEYGVVEGAYLIKNVNLGLAAYDTLCLICSELNIDLDKISDADFFIASIIIEKTASNANDKTGYTLSVWFDSDEQEHWFTARKGD